MATLATKGWDLVGAITQDSLNTLLAGLQNAGDLPTDFSVPVQIPLAGTAKVQITMGTPLVDLNPSAAAGTNSMAALVITVQSGSISTPSGLNIAIPMGSEITITTNLRYFDIDLSGGATSKRLALDFTSPEAVYNVNIDAPGWSSDYDSIVGTALLTYLQSEANGDYYLGTVNLSAIPAGMQPTGEVDFAIQTTTTAGQSVLLVLMTTTSGTEPSGTEARDFSDMPLMVSGGAPSALYVSNRLLMEQVLAPQLATGLGVDASQLSFTGNATSPVTVNFSGSKDLGGDDDPELVGLSSSVNGSQQVQSAYTVDAHPLFNAGKTYYVEVTGNLFTSFNLDTSNQQIGFTSTADKGSGSIKCSAWGWVIVAAAIVASFGTLGAFIGVVLAVVVPVVITQLKFPVSLPPSALNNLNQALGSVTWPGATYYPLTSVSLPGDLVLSGTPTVPGASFAAPRPEAAALAAV